MCVMIGYRMASGRVTEPQVLPEAPPAADNGRENNVASAGSHRLVRRRVLEMRRLIGVGGGILVVALVIVAVTRTASDDGEVSVRATGDPSETSPPSRPPEPTYPPTDPDIPTVTADVNLFERVTCPPGDLIAIGQHDPAPGFGDPVPEAALWSFLRATFPAAPEPSFKVTGRGEHAAILENGQSALLATMAEPGRWTVTSSATCSSSARQWTRD